MVVNPGTRHFNISTGAAIVTRSLSTSPADTVAGVSNNPSATLS